jgi:hypothetical protein
MDGSTPTGASGEAAPVPGAASRTLAEIGDEALRRSTSLLPWQTILAAQIVLEAVLPAIESDLLDRSFPTTGWGRVVGVDDISEALVPTKPSSASRDEGEIR